MEISEGSERIRLCAALTPRQPPGYFKISDYSTKSNADTCSSKGLDISFITTRLEHAAVLKNISQTLRHPLHRFCPQKYPLIIDADFLSLYTRQPHARPAREQLQHTSNISPFSNLRYRAPNAPLEGRERPAWGRGGHSTLPWRHVPGVLPPDELSLWDDIRCVLIQLFLHGSFVWVPVLLVWVWRRHCTTRRRKVIFALVVLSLVLFPIRPRPGIRKWQGWHKFHRYNRTSVIVENSEAFPPKEPTIYAVFPHGIVPAAAASMSCGNFGNLLGHFKLTAASIVRWCLIYGQLIFLSDAIPADKKSMKKSLEEGSNLLVSPGGIAEIYETSSKEERLHLQDRLGIVRLAMETGARLVPVYCFGHSQAYSLAWGARFLQPVARFGLPVAFRVPLMFAVGRPLQVPQVDDPSRKEVKAAHQVLVGEVQRIFDTYKGLYGWGDKNLEIV